MAAKKYLSLEEAAQLLGVRNDEIMRLRERGDLRGFADRGTWKFKSDDVEEAKRRLQPDSNPDVPLMDDDSALEDSDSDVKVSPAMSDSDVRLIGRDDLKAQLTGSSGDIPVFPAKKGSDSDVRLVSSGGELAKGPGSDSDVKLIKPKGSQDAPLLSDSDSDVRLTAPSKASLKDSDSDVRLTTPAGSLTDSDSDVRLALPGSDSDVKLVEPSGIQKRSGVAPLPDPDALDLDLSDSVLLDDDSGIALQADSGIRLTGDSSLRLSSESGIQLRRPADSGILLERPGESGFRLADDDDTAFKLAEDSGIKVGNEPPRSTSKLRQQAAAPLSDDDLESTAPMLFADSADLDRTDPEVPMLMDDDEDDLMPKSSSRDDRTQAETNVIMFDDDSEDELPARTRKASGGLSSKELDTAALEMESDEVLDEVFEADDDSFADEELEEVFEGEGDEFEDSFSEGMSAADFSVARPMIAAPETEWTGGTVMLLAFSLIFLMCGAWMAVDLLNTVAATGGTSYKGPFVELFGGFFKS